MVIQPKHVILPKLKELEQRYPDIFPLSKQTYKQEITKMGGLLTHQATAQAKIIKQVSIITITKDNPQGLEQTINSVNSQSYRPRLEYIIMDGGSEKESKRVLKKYEANIDFWLSLPDRGIYDAMNRGTLVSNCDWLLFLNGGDCFYKNTSLEELMQHCDDKDKLVYGDHEVHYVGKNYHRIHKATSIHSYYDLWHHMGFCHQSLVVRRKLQEQRLFDIHNLSADYKFVLSCFLDGHRIKHVPVIVSQVDTVGISQKKRIYMEWERWQVSRELRPSFWLPLGFLWILLSTSTRYYCQKLLGQKLTGKILRLKYWLYQ